MSWSCTLLHFNFSLNVSRTAYSDQENHVIFRQLIKGPDLGTKNIFTTTSRELFFYCLFKVFSVKKKKKKKTFKSTPRGLLMVRWENFRGQATSSILTEERSCTNEARFFPNQQSNYNVEHSTMCPQALGTSSKNGEILVDKYVFVIHWPTAFLLLDDVSFSKPSLETCMTHFSEMKFMNYLIAQHA